MSEDTRQVILTAAKKLFVRFGKRKTSVDEIARAAGVGKGTVYFHFKGKDEIWDTIVNDEVDKGIRRITDALAKAGTAREKLRTYIQVRYRVMGEELDLLNIQEGVLDELFPEIALLVGELKAKETEILTDILTEGVRRGEFREVDVELLAMSLVAVLSATGDYWIRKVRLVGAEKAIDNLLNIFFHGLLTDNRA